MNMEKLVLISDTPLSEGATIVRELGAMPGVSITSVSPSFIDIEVAQARSGDNVRAYARQHGLEVEDMPEAELMEPISPFRAL